MYAYFDDQNIQVKKNSILNTLYSILTTHEYAWAKLDICTDGAQFLVDFMDKRYFTNGNH